MNLFKLQLIISFLLISLLSTAQNIPFDKSAFKDRKEEFKAAKEALNEGDKLFEKEKYDLALRNYLEAQKFNPDNAKLNFQIARCYMVYHLLDKKKSLPYYENAFRLDPAIHKKIHLYLAEAHHLNSQWDKAIDEYQKEKSLVSKAEYAVQIPILDKKIKECKNGKELEKHPVRVFVDNLGPNVNTSFPEYGAVITTDESEVIFTSRRNDPLSKTNVADDFGGFYEDIYKSTRENGKWNRSTNLGPPINTENQDATCGLSPDGKTLIIYRSVNNGDLYESDLINGSWTKPESLNKNINTSSHEKSASISFDGNTLYFISDRSDLTTGGLDVFMTKKDTKGRWGPPLNLGPIINTPYNEEGIFAHPDGKTIYFSSEGHNSMGRFDVFKSVFENGKWGEPQNLGYPINTPDDDVYFVVNANGKRAYYASNQDGGFGQEDLYVVTMLGPEKPMILNTEDILISNVTKPVSELVIEPKVPVSTNELTLFKGRILDSLTHKPVTANILMIDNGVNQEIGKFTSDQVTGKFLVTLPSGKNYNVTVKADGYLFQSVNFDIPPGGDYQVIERDIVLNKVSVGMVIVLNNIFFDNDKFTLRKESEAELENLHKLLTDNPSLRIEISGHTDNKGAEAYNQKLSENRAHTVVTYLITKGINTARLEFKGYGMTKPIATNLTDEGRQHNRRTEFKILGK